MSTQQRTGSTTDSADTSGGRVDDRPNLWFDEPTNANVSIASTELDFVRDRGVVVVCAARPLSYGSDPTINDAARSPHAPLFDACSTIGEKKSSTAAATNAPS